jgi:hypothetical protein
MRALSNRDRLTAYISVWLFALAFGWIEASVVVYLRELDVRERALLGAVSLATNPVALVSVPGSLLSLEMAREACTMILLGAVGWLAGRRATDRIGAFLVAFGIWDIFYYVVLRLVSGWPDNLGTWDVLFLIPKPWVAPVWAPVTVALFFVLVGSCLFWTSERPRQYRWLDAAVFLASVALILAAFLARSQAVGSPRLPEDFPHWIFWSGVGLGLTGFAWAELRHANPEGRGHRLAFTKAPSDPRVEDRVERRREP